MFPEDSLNGTINYIITRLCNDIIINEKPRYNKINNILGVLEAVKLEFYRRLGVSYEDGAIEKNGDIECYVEEKDVNTPSMVEARDSLGNLATGLGINIRQFDTWADVTNEIKKLL